MKEVTYIGEHLLPGQLGNFFVILSFTAALLATISYFFSSREPLKGSWNTLGRISFGVHAFAVVGIVVTLFYMIVNHYFEYQYVWQHSSRDLPVRYMLSCFWEGQEGSFLLWTFWHVILGGVLIRRAGEWEPSVMAVVCAVQVFLASMLLGVYFGDFRLGSNPFLLLREHPEFSNLPFVKVADYLKSLDGRGLNPLLQNYWMTIHPPILFLGFAATLVPFAYAVAGLMRKKFSEWVKPALPWTFFGVMILGTGILMGGAWAYESLSFGGFWAWDPVENASLVPWITLVASGHLMLIYQSRKKSLKTTIVLAVLTFILILYSTFLTRSGILGDTSVHAFTDLGMSGQLLIYLFFFLLLPAALFAYHYKKIPGDKDEDALSSREFWMFIGALVLIISAFQITFTTSIPVINKVFGTSLAPPPKVIEHYNGWQTPLAILICFLVAATQFMRYKETPKGYLVKKLGLSFILAFVLTGVISFTLKIGQAFHILLLLASLFAFIANLDYLLRILNGKVSKAGASIAHAGFALIVCGALVSMSKSNVISRNNSNIDLSKLGTDFSNNENIMLTRGDTVEMGDYLVTYTAKEKKGIETFFNIEYLEKEESSLTKAFTLNPLVQNNPRMGLLAEPATHHQIHRDIYTHVTYAPVKKEQQSAEDTGAVAKSFALGRGDTVFTSTARLVMIDLDKNVDRRVYNLKETDLAVAAVIEVTDIRGNTKIAKPVYVIRGTYIIPEPAVLPEFGMKLNFNSIDTETGKVGLEVLEKETREKDFVVLKAIVFPGINILWAGSIIMMLGSILAVIDRVRILRRNAN